MAIAPEMNRCPTTRWDGLHCELGRGHRSYHAAKTGSVWAEWHDGDRAPVKPMPPGHPRELELTAHVVEGIVEVELDGHRFRVNSIEVGEQPPPLDEFLRDPGRHMRKPSVVHPPRDWVVTMRIKPQDQTTATVRVLR